MFKPSKTSSFGGPIFRFSFSNAFNFSSSLLDASSLFPAGAISFPEPLCLFAEATSLHLAPSQVAANVFYIHSTLFLLLLTVTTC